MRRLSAFRNSCLVVLLILLSIQSNTIAAPPSDGSNSTITSDEEWSSDGVFDGSVVIASGATLTVSANMTIAEDSSITVSQGGTLDIDSGSMHAESENYWLTVYPNEASIEVPLQGIGGDTTIRIYFSNNITSGTSLKAGFNGSALQDVTGNFVDFTSNLAPSTDYAKIDLQTPSLNTVHITRITVLEGSDNNDVEDIRSLVYRNMKADGAISWSINIQQGGTLHTNSATLSSINLECFGNCSLTATTMRTFEPIDLGATGTLNLDDCNLNGSITDEDVKGSLGAQVNWDEDSEGTGGDVDRWTIKSHEQTLTAPLFQVEIGIEGFEQNGYFNLPMNVSTGTGGTATLPPRIVQWMDSSGTVNSDNATIVSIRFKGAEDSWGIFYGEPQALGTDDVELSLDLPEISITSLEVVDSEATSGDPVVVKATVKNDGATASIKLICEDSSGGDVSTSPTFIPVNATSGQSVVVEFTWTQYSDGKESLSCEPVVPNAFSDNPDMVLGDSSSATSGELDWQEPIEANDGGMVTIIIVAISIAVAALLFMSKRETDKEYDVEVPEDEDSDAEESEDAEEEAIEESED